MDLTAFADAVGITGPVTIRGLATRGGGVPGLRTVAAPAGIEWIEPAEMTVSCGAATPVDDLVAALAVHGQTVNLPPGGTVGGALSKGVGDHRLLGYGPIRDCLLQVHYVSSEGRVVKAGGPTVKNVSGFDLCRLLVGALGTLGFLGSVILRTRPRAAASQWFRSPAGADRDLLQRTLYRPVSLLWDGVGVDVLLEGHPDDVADQAARFGLEPRDTPPTLPRWRVGALAGVAAAPGRYVEVLGCGVAYASEPPGPRVAREARLVALAGEVKRRFDPMYRLNPGVVP